VSPAPTHQTKMKNKPTHFYQLVLYGTTSEEVLYPVFSSRLYLSEKECRKRCPDEEMNDILAAIGRMYPGQLEEDIENCDGTEEDYLELVAKVKKWLEGETDDYFIEPPELTNDDDPLQWTIESHEVAEDEDKSVDKPQPIFTRAETGRKYYTFDTRNLLDFVEEQDSCVEAEIHNGQIRCTHWFDYDEANEIFTHEGIDGEERTLTHQEILDLYPKTRWIVWLDTLCSEFEMMADNEEEEP